MYFFNLQNIRIIMEIMTLLRHFFFIKYFKRIK